MNDEQLEKRKRVFLSFRCAFLQLQVNMITVPLLSCMMMRPRKTIVGSFVFIQFTLSFTQHFSGKQQTHNFLISGSKYAMVVKQKFSSRKTEQKRL